MYEVIVVITSGFCLLIVCLQCVDAVGWATVRASDW